MKTKSGQNSLPPHQSSPTNRTNILPLFGVANETELNMVPCLAPSPQNKSSETTANLTQCPCVNKTATASIAKSPRLMDIKIQPVKYICLLEFFLL